MARARGRWLREAPAPLARFGGRAASGRPGRNHDRGGGAARFAEGVKCLKYGGGSERPRNPHPPARGPAAFPAAPRSPPRRLPRGGWKLERKPESCPLRTPRLLPARGRAEQRCEGGTTPRRPAGSSLTGKKFARIGAGLLHLLREVAGGRQRSEPHLVWQSPPCRGKKKMLKGPFPSSARGNLFFSCREKNPGSLSSSPFFAVSMCLILKLTYQRREFGN